MIKRESGDFDKLAEREFQRWAKRAEWKESGRGKKGENQGDGSWMRST